MSKTYSNLPIQIIEDWNERDGKIYYRWREVNSPEWYEKLTPYKEKPYVQFKVITETEFTMKYLPAKSNYQSPKEGQEGV